MPNRGAKETAESRLVLWARAELSKEINGQFPVLGTFPTGPAHAAKVVLEQLPQPERHTFATALLKRWAPPEALLALGEQISDVDSGILRRYEQSIRATMQSDWMIREEIRASGRPPLRRKDLGRLVQHGLSLLFGEPMEVGQGNWRYRTCYGEWTLETSLSTSGNFHQLTYNHAIAHEAAAYRWSHLSILSLFGIAGQTYWSDLTEGECDGVAQCLVGLCEGFAEEFRHFLNSD